MTERKKPKAGHGSSLSSLASRLLGMKPDDAEREIANSIVGDREVEEALRSRVRRELEDGARPKNGRFRL